MKTRWILTLLLACGVAGAGAEEDLEFARRLAARGLDQMASQLLDKLVESSNSAESRAGRYGKALLTKEQANRAKYRFLRALEEGAEPPVTREQVIGLYEESQPQIEAYVRSRAQDVEPRFLLGELLQEYAEFLVGSEYPDEMADERQKLVDSNKERAAKLFEKAIGNFKTVCDELKKKLGDKVDPENPDYVRCTNAEFMIGLARFRWALVYPKGANFQYRIDEAIEELDEFLQRHYEELFGAYAMVYLGRAFMEKGLRTGDSDDVETAINYFESLFAQVPEDPAVPDTSKVIGEAFYWYAYACNAMATGAGGLKKEQPIFLENTIRAGSLLPQKLKYGAKTSWALKAQLEIADAHAMQQNFEEAVRIAGDVLASARVEGHRIVGKIATAKLKKWVASVAGAGALDPGLLFQIGESLAAQGRIGNAITFYEKAAASATSDADKETWAYPARLKIAMAYRKDKRLFAAAAVSWALVEEFLNSGQEEESDFGVTAAEACNQARLAYRTISDATKRSTDKDRYDRILDTFRGKFPAHPENADKAFSEAFESEGRGDLELAARLYKDLNPTSKNFWRAQRRIPSCYRRLAMAEKDPEKKKQWHEKCLESALALESMAQGKPDDPGSKKTLQHGHLYAALAYHALERWPDALEKLESYSSVYPDAFIKRGFELKALVDAYLASKQVEKAEAALALLKEKQPGSPYVRGTSFDVFAALRKHYKAMATGTERSSAAARAALLWEQILQTEKSILEVHYYTLGDTLRDAHRWDDAGEGFESAAGMVADPKRKSFYKQLAAEMKFKAAREGLANKTIKKKDYIKILEEARQLFTDVLIPDKANQAKVLRKLADWKNYPSRQDFAIIKRKPQEIFTAAEIYMESNPAGLDGRWITCRLVAFLHTFTKATVDENRPNKQLDPLVPLWWDAAELKLKAYLEISKSGGGQSARAAKQKGQAFARKLMFQYKKMDGPERVARIKELAAKLGR